MEKNYKRHDEFDAQRIERLAYHYREILSLLGEDPDREGLVKSPERIAKAMSFVTKGYAEDPIQIIKSATFSEEYNHMVLVKDIELFSMCEHHMMPFIGKAHVHISPMARSQVCRKLPAWWSALPAACRCRSV